MLSTATFEGAQANTLKEIEPWDTYDDLRQNSSFFFFKWIKYSNLHLTLQVF